MKGDMSGCRTRPAAVAGLLRKISIIRQLPAVYRVDQVIELVVQIGMRSRGSPAACSEAA
jgi:hypothetical protein